uniref:Exportin-4 n=2 Tax=Schistocephalus solidus TaxID=70667 RepID=A0A0X3PCL1_SCHSO
MSNTGDFTRLNLPLEAHVFMQARFQSYELLEIFRKLLHLIDTFLHDPSWPGDNFDQNETVYRLVHCLEMVMSWNFLPNQIIEESSLRCCMGRENPLRPSDKWECVFGSAVLPSSLSLLLHLHARLRSSSALGSRTLACIVQLSNIQGPLVTRLPSVLALSPEEQYLLADHAATVMDCVSRWLPDHSSLPSAACTALLMRDTPTPSPSHSVYRQLLPQLPAFRVEELVQSACQSATAVSITSLHTYELPLLAELAVNLLRRLSETFALLERVISGSAWSNNETENAQTVLSRLLFYLSAGHNFFLFTFSVLTRCILVEARQDDDMASDTSPAHEASERLFAYLSDVLHFPRFDGEDELTVGSPGRHSLPLTTGPTAVRDQMIGVLKQACCQLKTLFLEQQTQVLKLYFAAHLASPVGFRRDDQTDCEELDLSIDEDDQCSFEDSLFAIGHFASASSLGSVIALLANLLEERTAQLLQLSQTSNGLGPPSSSSSAPNERSYTLMEDLHWILLICGHILVSGPSQLGSSKGGLPSWDSDFMMRSGIWSAGDKEYNDNDVAICKRFLFCALENSPLPTDVQPQIIQLPSILRLFSVLFRLFRLQVSSRVGSAQLTEDTFWLMSRLAITYLANSQVEDFSGTQADTPSLPTLSQLLIRPPGGTSAAAISTFPAIIASLVVSTRLAMSTWMGEPKITSLASCLLSILARHSLQQLKNTTGCPPWMDFCDLLCSREAIQANTWSTLPVETLTELIDSCVRGCWSLRHSVGIAASCEYGAQPTDPFFQFLGQLKSQIEPLVTPLTETAISSEVSTKLVSCLAAVCGLTRAFRWIAANSEAGDLISWLWTAIFMPVCQNAVTHLFQRCHMCHDVTLAIIGLLYEMADNCLVYLADCPAATSGDLDALSAQLGDSLKFKDNLASAQFFIFSTVLCAQYASVNAHRATADSDDQQSLAELRLFMELLNFFLSHEFELRLYRDPATEPNRNGTSLNPSPPLGAVDVTIICLGYLLPLLTESILMEPEFCSKFYSLVSYALELRAEGLVHLSDSNIAHLGRLVRLGLFQDSSAPQTSVSIGCLEVITCLTDCCLDVFTSAATADSSWRLQLSKRLITNFPLDRALFSDLFFLVLGPVFSSELENYLSTTLLALIHLNPDMFDELVKRWVASCPNEDTQHRLQSAFQELSEPLNRVMQSAKTPLSPLTGAIVLGRPSRTERVDFQQLFRSFVLCVRAFLCNF